MSALEPLLAPVRAIVRDASERILEVYGTDFAVDQKDDRSPVTQADRLAHETIFNGLTRLTPGIPVFSEEAEAVAFPERSRWKRYWLVDPLDGTKEFVKRNGEFTVNVALIEGHQVSLGVVHVPVTGSVYFAARGIGAFRATPERNSVERIHTRTLEAKRISIAASRSHSGARLEAFIERLPGEVELVRRGSSLKFCMVAEGSADIYPRFGPTSEWDTAAAQCIVEQAGGSVTDFQFRPIVYNAKEDVLNPHFVVVGDPSFDWIEWLDGA